MLLVLEGFATSPATFEAFDAPHLAVVRLYTKISDHEYVADAIAAVRKDRTDAIKALRTSLPRADVAAVDSEDRRDRFSLSAEAMLRVERAIRVMNDPDWKPPATQATAPATPESSAPPPARAKERGTSAAALERWTPGCLVGKAACARRARQGPEASTKGPTKMPK